MQGITSTRLGDIYVRREADIIKVRERVRRLARELGFDSTTQIKITTAVSELTRNIYEYARARSEEHTSELQSRQYLVCRLLLEKKKNNITHISLSKMQLNIY